MAGTSPPQEMASRIHALWARFAVDGHLSWPQYSSPTNPVFELASGAVEPGVELPAARFVP